MCVPVRVRCQYPWLLFSSCSHPRPPTIARPRHCPAPAASAAYCRHGHHLCRHGHHLSHFRLASLPLPLPLPLSPPSDDGNQFCRLVREALTELDLPYTLVSVGKESPRRADLAAIAGRSTAPYLTDANTGVAMGESADICAYLYREYSA